LLTQVRPNTVVLTIASQVAVVVSGVLSHTHADTGPYGYSAPSAAMDAALGSWAAAPCAHAHDLLVMAAALQNQALSCGFTGFVLLHGMLCGVDGNHHIPNTHRREWNSQVLVNWNVTYYGMMVARYERKA
jgi:aromatic ring-opening dioxygenase LigB subunit